MTRFRSRRAVLSTLGVAALSGCLDATSGDDRDRGVTGEPDDGSTGDGDDIDSTGDGDDIDSTGDGDDTDSTGDDGTTDEPEAILRFEPEEEAPLSGDVLVFPEEFRDLLADAARSAGDDEQPSLPAAVHVVPEREGVTDASPFAGLDAVSLQVDDGPDGTYAIERLPAAPYDFPFVAERIDDEDVPSDAESLVVEEQHPDVRATLVRLIDGETGRLAGTDPAYVVFATFADGGWDTMTAYARYDDEHYRIRRGAITPTPALGYAFGISLSRLEDDASIDATLHAEEPPPTVREVFAAAVEDHAEQGRGYPMDDLPSEVVETVESVAFVQLLDGHVRPVLEDD